MDLDELATFVRVADFGSFSKAAAGLRQPKSRVSRRIAALESALGVALIYRTTRQFGLTEAGRTLYEKAREHVYALESAAQSLLENAREVAGSLRIQAAEDFGAALLGPFLAELAELHPRLSVEVMLSNDFVDLVKERIDLGIWIGDLGDSTYRRRLLGRVSLILVASPEYLRRLSPIASLSDLALHPALVFAVEDEPGVWELRRSGGRDERVKVRIGCRANNPRVLLDLALAGKGVALIPEFHCIEPLRRGTLERVLPAYATRSYPVHFVWPGRTETSPKVKAFVDLGLKRLGRYFV